MVAQGRLFVGLSVSRSGPASQLSQQRPHRFRHVGFRPVMVRGVVTVTDLELVAELVGPARSVHAGNVGIGGQERDSQALLHYGQVGRINGGDHVQTREATASDQLQLHETTVASTTPGYLLPPRRTSASADRHLDSLPACSHGVRLGAGDAVP